MLQKNVLDYLDSSAARFPHKLAFADEARSFTFGQLRACARGLGTALADLGPQHNRPVAVLVNHTAANLSASGVIHGGDDSAQAMADPLTRADVAELLDGAMDVMADQDGSIWFSWS